MIPYAALIEKHERFVRHAPLWYCGSQSERLCPGKMHFQVIRRSMKKPEPGSAHKRACSAVRTQRTRHLHPARQIDRRFPVAYMPVPSSRRYRRIRIFQSVFPERILDDNSHSNGTDRIMGCGSAVQVAAHNGGYISILQRKNDSGHFF